MRCKCLVSSEPYLPSDLLSCLHPVDPFFRGGLELLLDSIWTAFSISHALQSKQALVMTESLLSPFSHWNGMHKRRILLTGK